MRRSKPFLLVVMAATLLPLLGVALLTSVKLPNARVRAQGTISLGTLGDDPPIGDLTLHSLLNVKGATAAIVYSGCAECTVIDLKFLSEQEVRSHCLVVVRQNAAVNNLFTSPRVTLLPVDDTLLAKFNAYFSPRWFIFDKNGALIARQETPATQADFVRHFLHAQNLIEE